MKVEHARLIDGQYVCYRCTCHLAAPIPAEQSDRPGLVTASFYRRVEDPTGSDVTILTLPKRFQATLRATGMPTPGRRKRRTGARGLIPDVHADVRGYPLPVVMPCWRPSCPQINRIDVDDPDDLAV